MPTIESQEDLRLKWKFKTPEQVLDACENDRRTVKYCQENRKVERDTWAELWSRE